MGTVPLTRSFWCHSWILNIGADIQVRVKVTNRVFTQGHGHTDWQPLESQPICIIRHRATKPSHQHHLHSIPLTQQLKPHPKISLLPLPIHLPQHLPCRHRSKPRHNLDILLLTHPTIPLTLLRHNPKIVNIKRWRIRIKELRLLIRRVGERVRRTHGNRNVIAHLRVDVGVVRRVEAHGALGDEEGFVVHFVPVGGRAGGVRGEGEFGAADAVVWWGVCQMG